MPDYLPPLRPAGLENQDSDAEKLRSLSLLVGGPIVLFAWLVLTYSLLIR
jgi:hypothetical protein